MALRYREERWWVGRPFAPEGVSFPFGGGEGETPPPVFFVSMPRLADAHRDREELVRPCGGTALPVDPRPYFGELFLCPLLLFGLGFHLMLRGFRDGYESFLSFLPKEI
jgi:hypothetical protein